MIIVNNKHQRAAAERASFIFEKTLYIQQATVVKCDGIRSERVIHKAILDNLHDNDDMIVFLCSTWSALIYTRILAYTMTKTW
jgi:hypothetical protein